MEMQADHSEQIHRIESTTRREGRLRASGWRDEDFFSLMERKNIPGASMVVMDGGEIAWEQTAGVADIRG